MRRACFSIILYMIDSAIDVEGFSPLAPLATDSLFASQSGLFDMVREGYPHFSSNGTRWDDNLLRICCC